MPDNTTQGPKPKTFASPKRRAQIKQCIRCGLNLTPIEIAKRHKYCELCREDFRQMEGR